MQFNIITPENLKFQITTLNDQEPHKQCFNLSKLYNFVQTFKNLHCSETLSKITFENKALLEIAHCLASHLNRPQTEFSKYYMEALCVFLELSNIRPYGHLTCLLKEPFFDNLPLMFSSIMKCWKQNRGSQKSSLARAQVIVYLKRVTQIAEKREIHLQKIYNKKYIDLLETFSHDNEPEFLKLLIKSMIQANKKGDQYNKKLIKRLFYFLKQPNYPLSTFLSSIQLIVPELHTIFQFHSIQDIVGVINNLKYIIIKRLSQQNFDSLLTFIVRFIIKICNNLGVQAYTWTDLFYLCTLVNCDYQYPNKIQSLKDIAYSIIVFQNQNGIDEIKQFLDYTSTYQTLDMMIPIISKFSSARLVKISTSNFLAKVSGIFVQESNNIKYRVKAKKVLRLLMIRMEGVNLFLYSQMHKRMKELYEIVLNNNQSTLNIQLFKQLEEKEEIFPLI